MDNNDIRINFKIQVLNSQDIYNYLILNKIIFMLCLYMTIMIYVNKPFVIMLSTIQL